MSNESHEPEAFDASETADTPVPSEVEGPGVSEVEGPVPSDAEGAIMITPSRAEGRHDGWSGDKMARFCEVLADTAVVAEACDQAGMGISGAYALRRRNPFFAAAWDASLTIARERLADTLLARSMEGNVEQIYRDGELVGERHVIDNRLGLAILKRLDRLAETGMTVSTRGERFLFPGGDRSAAQQRSPTILPYSQSFDWEMMVDALRTGDPEAVASALAQLRAESHEVEEVEDPPVTLSRDAEPDEDIDLTDRCWKDGIDNIWLTDFPPPADFAGYESRPWDEDDPGEHYERECTPEEAALLDANGAADENDARADDEALRDALFGQLRDEAKTRHPGLEPGPAFTSAAEEESRNPLPNRARSDSLDE